MLEFRPQRSQKWLGSVLRDQEEFRNVRGGAQSENAALDALESNVIGRIDLVAPRAIYICLGYMIRGPEI